MSISRNTQELVAKQDFDAIEGDWLARMDESPENLDYFVTVARALVGQGEQDRARMLLDMLDEALTTEGAWRDRLELLKRSGKIYKPNPETQHRAIMSSMEAIHGDHHNFDGLVETVGLDKAKTDIPKTWDKVGRLESLLTFSEGSLVSMEGKGAGRVVEVNLELQSFRIDFDGFPRMPVGFRAAPKVLTPVPKGHIHYRKLEEPKQLKEDAQNDPSGVLRTLLQSYDQPRTAGEIKQDLVGIVPDKKWTSWWANARKHPQVVSGGKGRRTYAWAASSEDAEDAVWTAFLKAKPRKKLARFRRDGDRSQDLRGRMAEALIREAGTQLSKDPGFALETWFYLDRVGEAPADAAFSPAVLLGPEVDPRPTLAGMEERPLRQQAFEILQKQREDWADLYMAALPREDDPKLLDYLTEALEAIEHPDLPRFYDGTLAQPNKAPGAFAWLVERAGDNEELRRRSPLRLFQQALAGPTMPELSAQRLRLLAQVESGGTVVKLLSLLTEDQAAQAEEAVHRAAGLEPYQREDLIKALQVRFASLRDKSDEAKPLYAMEESINSKRDEMNDILKNEIPANRKAIEEARAMGDLRENFEYKSARQRHEYLTARATELKEQLARARPIDLASIDPSEVRVGTRVSLLEDGEKERTLVLLGPWESEPEAGIISYESELGRAMLGLGEGAELTVGGHDYRIRSIAVYEP